MPSNVSHDTPCESRYDLGHEQLVRRALVPDHVQSSHRTRTGTGRYCLILVVAVASGERCGNSNRGPTTPTAPTTPSGSTYTILRRPDRVSRRATGWREHRGVRIRNRSGCSRMVEGGIFGISRWGKTTHRVVAREADSYNSVRARMARGAFENRCTADGYTSGDTWQARALTFVKTRKFRPDFDAEGWPSGRWRWHLKTTIPNGWITDWRNARRQPQPNNRWTGRPTARVSRCYREIRRTRQARSTRLSCELLRRCTVGSRRESSTCVAPVR